MRHASYWGAFEAVLSCALIAFLGLTAAAPAAWRNLAALILVRHLARADVVVTATTLHGRNRTVVEFSNGLPRWLPVSSMGPVVAAWDGLLADDPERTTDALTQAARVKSGFTRSLDDFVRAEGRLPAAYSVARMGLTEFAPMGLAEYEYGRAVSAAGGQDWIGSLQAFERAVLHRPGPWPPRFIVGYSATFAKARPDVAERIVSEQASATSMPQVKVGRKDQPGWETAIPLADGRRLEGFSVRSWTALERGLPFVLDLFWAGVAEERTRETVQAWNLVANGGLELSTPALPNQFGWVQMAGFVASPALTRTVVRDGRTSSVLVSTMGHGDASPETWARQVGVKSGSDLLWSVWIESSGGNPHLFLTWYDAEGKRLRDEIPVQGNIRGPGRNYAGVLHVPATGTVLSIMLTNWKGAGEVYWDDLLLVDLGSLSERR